MPISGRSPVTLFSVQTALQEIRPFVHKTPVVTSSIIDALCPGANILLKCENLQRVGAFKIRGATYAIRCILAASNDPSDETLEPENLTVVTHSSGNHAQALALAAKQLGVRCHVVMPSNAPSVKKAAVRGYGASVTFCEPTLSAREETSQRVMAMEREAGRRVEFIPPYNDARVISGQGTLALEFLEQAEELGKPLDILITPVGGGGMLSGCAVAVKGTSPTTLVFGAEPLGADDAYRSFESKTLQESIAPNTIADGLLTSLGDITFPLILEHVDGIFTVTEAEIKSALRLVYERLKLVIEPSAAVPLAVVLYSTSFRALVSTLSEEKKLNIGAVFSGGNVELSKVLKIFEEGESILAS